MTRQAVQIALKRNPNRCPIGWALALSEYSKIPRTKLRPDIYPPRETRIEVAVL